MPVGLGVLRNVENWVKPFREQVRASTAPDWWVINNRGWMRLQVKDAGSVSLPYPWTLEGSTRALPRIQQIFKRWAGGQITLKAAAQGANTSSSHQKLDILKLAEEFRKTRPTCGDTNWKNKYLPVLRHLSACLEGNNRPKDGTDLCQQALEQWEHGSRQRQVMRQAAYAFLRWGVERGHLKSCYLPPVTEPEVKKPKRIGYPLSDAQILRLLDSLPQGEAHERWRFGLQLMAVYGLRPEELRWLRIKDDQLWCFYRKSQGGRKGAKTDPRRLYPLFVRDIDGTPIDWNLQGRIQINEELPPLNREGDGGNAVNQYLRRRSTWLAMRAEAEQVSEQLTPYSFRHRYAKRSHAMNLPIANIAAAMGHTIEVHLGSYTRFKPDATQDLYAAANA